MSSIQRQELILKKMKERGIEVGSGVPNKKYDNREVFELIHISKCFPELREKIADLYWRWYKIKVDPERIIVTPGSSGSFILAFTGLFDVGDTVGIGSPGYPSYRQILKALSLNTCAIKTTSDNKFQPVATDIIDNNLDGLLIASPANPTGSMLNKDELEGLMEACDQKQTVFISDEIYHGIEYDARAVSALEISDDCFVINSFSKYFSINSSLASATDSSIASLYSFD